LSRRREARRQSPFEGDYLDIKCPGEAVANRLKPSAPANDGGCLKV
jgi:hypothetical protein